LRHGEGDAGDQDGSQNLPAMPRSGKRQISQNGRSAEKERAIDLRQLAPEDVGIVPVTLREAAIGCERA